MDDCGCVPHAKSWLIGKDSDAGRDWGQEEKGMTEDEMAGWHHGLDGRESKWTLGVGDGQAGLACCDSCDRKQSDTTEWLNWTELWLCANKTLFKDTETRTSYNCYVKQKPYSFLQTLEDIKTKFSLCAIEKQAEAELADPGFRAHLPDITIWRVANITLTTSCSRAWEPESSSRLVSLSSSISHRFWCLISGHTACEWQCQAGAWVSWFKSYLPSPEWVSEVVQSCPTLCHPVDCSPPGFSVHGILQARILEWVTISFSRGSRPWDQTRISHIGGRHFNLWATREAFSYSVPKIKISDSSTATKSFCHFSSAVHHFFHFKGIYSNKYLKIKDSVSSSGS